MNYTRTTTEGLIKEVSVSEEQRKALKKLASSEHFETFKELADTILQARAFDTMAMIEAEKGEAHEATDNNRGAYQFWQQLQAYITKAIQYDEEQ